MYNFTEIFFTETSVENFMVDHRYGALIGAIWESARPTEVRKRTGHTDSVQTCSTI